MAKARCVFVMTKTSARLPASIHVLASEVGQFKPKNQNMEKKFYKGGAPEKSEEEKRERMVQVRFTGEEYDQLDKRRQTTMARNMSCFVRSVCLEKPLLIKTQMETYQDIALSLLREIRSDLLRIGVNINQSSRRINSTTDYHDLRRDVNQMSTNMTTLEAQLRMLIAQIPTDQPSTDPAYDHPNQ